MSQEETLAEILIELKKQSIILQTIADSSEEVKKLTDLAVPADVKIASVIAKRMLAEVN